MGEAMRERAWTLTREQVAAWIDALRGTGKLVVAPVERQGLRVFRPVACGAEACLEDHNTAWSPKEFLFPRTEELVRWEAGGADVTLSDPPWPDVEQVLFGVRPCDAAGLVRLDGVLVADPRYALRRALTSVVVLGCARAAPECFCSAAGGSPVGDEGADAILLPLDGAFLLRPVTARGQALAASSKGPWTEASPQDRDEALARGRRVAASIRAEPVARGGAEALEASFKSPVWADLGRACLGCSVCTYVCPSCSCFDVQDEGGPGCGTRCRGWDSCTFAGFTRHASGHNPRPTQASRYRQRVLHKFAYFPLQHGGRSMCVGCGRCVRLCPAGLDIRRTVATVLGRVRAPQEAGNAGG
jgi:formate hydrogenlyase subunit 6/NADH:ubiquinone oxidoreductase subunit I